MLIFASFFSFLALTKIGYQSELNLHDSIRSTVCEGTSKQRLDQYVTSLLPGTSRSLIAAMCDHGLITVNDVIRPKHYKISAMDEVCVQIEQKTPTEVKPENITLDILYEDEHILAINKPAGMVVHPAPGSPNGTFVNALLHYLGDEASTLLRATESDSFTQIVDDDFEEEMEGAHNTGGVKDSPQSLRPGIVHRLDKGTSGVLLAGKHPDAVAKLSALFASRKITKVYLAICVGNPGEATISESIGRCLKNRQEMAIFDGPPGMT